MTGRTISAPQLLPASFAQRRLWLLDQMDSGNAAYNLVMAMRLRGPLDLSALRSALEFLVARHDALRTTFTEVGGEPYQKVAGEAPVSLAVTDLRDVAAEQRAALAQATIEQEVAQVFDLACGPLLRTSLLRLAEDDHVLGLICHHSICDGWSMGVLLAELAAVYEARCQGSEPGLAPPRMRFGQHATRQRTELDGERLRASVAFWRLGLAGAPALLELPTTHARPAVQGFAGATHRTKLDPALWEAVLAMARRRRMTPFMVLLSVFAALLSRLSGARDLVIGTPVAGRTRRDLASVVGMFVNTLPLRIDLSGHPSFTELLGRVRRTTLAAFTHQEIPLERIVAEVAAHRTTSHDPLFQTMFALQQPVELPDFPGLTTEIFPVGTSTVFTDLWLEIRPGTDGVDCALHYRTELFDAADIERIAARYVRMLSNALAAPETALARLGLLDEGETERILRVWSQGGPAHPWAGPVHEMIDHQARSTPTAAAIIFENERLSYARLAGRAGTLARLLTARGVGPETVVALCLERSVELVISVVAVLAAGGAYLPLSPEDPPARLAHLLRSSGATAVLTAKKTAPALAASGVPVIVVDELVEDAAGRAGESMVQGAVGPDALAYVIYTSGSTGEPKSVGVPHGGLANRIACMRRSHPLTAADRVMHKTPYTFDVSVWELLWPLTVGATLVVAAPGGHRDPAYLVELIERESVTTIHFVPPMLEGFLGQPDLDRCRSLTRVICSGQALPGSLRDRCLASLPVRLVNLYGPTEASIEVTEWECLATQHDSGVPIGRPLAGVETYVLDSELQPVPPGVIGELYLGGVALARGYLGRPALTADRFVPSPFSRQSGARLYRTGDLVRWRADGSIDYLGRNDHQLKVRGFRIEPGEIENTLRLFPAVRDAAVTAHDSGLTAYVVPRNGSDADDLDASMRQLLRERLPEYMVPSQFVLLPQLPLGRNGKVDRAALPEPAPMVGTVRPRDAIERALADIWAEVLGRECTGVLDDFFEIGGDSLKSIQIVHRARRAGLRLTVTDIFRYPTISDLAAQLRGAGQAIHQDWS